jgi:FlaA1/EpsC-like NDP-sugar epimerase
VLPIFADLIKEVGPVTVTHKDMKRFFMSIPEAVNLVLQAAAFGHGGEIFMLDMGEEVRIQDLAERMIRLQGLRIHKDISIKYIGVRPGEKLHEALHYDEELQMPTPHPRIFQLRTNRSFPPLCEFREAVGQLEIYLGQPGGSKRLRRGIFHLAAQEFNRLILPDQFPRVALEHLPRRSSKQPPEASRIVF